MYSCCLAQDDYYGVKDKPKNVSLGSAVLYTRPQVISLCNDVWEMSTEIHTEDVSLTRSGKWCVINMGFLCLFLRRHFAGKPVVASWNVSCFLWLKQWKFQVSHNRTSRTTSSVERPSVNFVVRSLRHFSGKKKRKNTLTVYSHLSLRWSMLDQGSI